MDPVDPVDRPLLPRRRHRGSAGEGEEPASSGDAEILNVTARLQELIARRREAAPAAPATPQSTRLRPSGRSTGAPTPTGGETVAEVLAAAEAAVPVMKSRQFKPSAEARLEKVAGRWLRRIGVVLGAVVLPVILAFLTGRWSAPQDRGGAETPSAPTAAVINSPAPPARAARWSAASLGRLEELLAARQTGNAERALGLAQSLRGTGGSLPGLDLLEADLQVRARRSSQAVRLLLPLHRLDPPLPAASDRLGLISARERKLEEAADYFATAATTDPLSGIYFYHWGEALRRQGKATEAAARLEQALLRPRNLTNSVPAFTGLKLRLARLEAGRADEVRRELDARRQAPPLGESPAEAGRWRMAAAALALQEKRFAEAAGELQRARTELSAGAGGGPEFDLLVGDYFFRAHAGRAELAEFFPPAGSPEDAQRVAALTTAPEAVFVDP